MSAAEEREKTAAAVAALGALPMPVGPEPRSEGACALRDVVKPDRHALQDHVLNVHPDEFCGVYHVQPCQYDRRERYTAALRAADPYALVERRDDRARFTDAVIAVADAEQAALRARVAELEQAEPDLCADCGHVESAHAEDPDERPCNASGARVRPCTCAWFIPRDGLRVPSASESADKLTRLLAPSQALREDEAAHPAPCRFPRSPDCRCHEVEPNDCGECGQERRSHARRWTPEAGWHKWVQPSNAAIKARMLARRAARLGGTS